MEVTRLAIPLILSRLGEMTVSLFYFSFIGHFIINSLSHASFAWALTSFLTVVGIGFFSTSLMKVAGSTDLNAKSVELDLVISFRLAFFYGAIIVSAIFAYSVSKSRSLTDNGNLEELKLLLILSLSIPALYLQITIFNFFNAIKIAKYELIYTWLFNATLASACAILIATNTNTNAINFISTYVGLRCFFVVLAFRFFDRKIHQHILKFRHSQSIPTKAYVNYFISGLPMALCFGGESLLFLMLSFISKSLGDASLSAYQASLHFLSVVYMISIGVGNATGIVAARHFKLKKFHSLSTAYIQGITLGAFILAPFLLVCFFFNEYISIIYTFDVPTRKLIEGNLLISIPFLVFEYIYVVTRMTLRSMGDFWIPTLFTISLLNILGLILSVGLLSFYNYSVHSIFVALVLCSFFLMSFLLWRLGSLLRQLNHQLVERQPPYDRA
jgi:MATE family multidrug resistance protein